MQQLRFCISLLLLSLCLVSAVLAQGGPATGSAMSGQDNTVVQDIDPNLRREAGLDPTLAYKQNVQLKVSQVEIGDFPTIRAFVSVVDENGYEITTLSQHHFEVLENSEPVNDLRFSSRDELNLPLSVVFVVDISGSMSAVLDDDGTSALDLEVQAIRQFVEQLNPRDKVGLISFSDSYEREVPLDNDHARLIRRLDMLTAIGQTTLWDGIYRGMQEILSDTIPARRAIIVLSDGEDNASLENPRTIIEFYQQEAIKENQQFTVYSIGLGKIINRRGLGDIATRTGGIYVDSPSAADLTDLYQDILRQINREYLLEYEAPVASKPGDIIDLEVGLNIVQSYSPGTYTYRSPGLAKALARAFWPGLILIAGLLAILIIATIFKLNRRTWITVMVTALEGRDYVVAPIGANIGSSEACEVIIRNDPAILPLHASLTESNDGFVLEATDPDSPLFVDGRALVRKLLRDRDRVVLGHTAIVFHERAERMGDGRELQVDHVVDSRPESITEDDQLAAAGGAEQKPRVKPVALVGTNGPFSEVRFELATGDNTVGRTGPCSILLENDMKTSRLHCRLEVTEDYVILEDMGSANGTLLNGKSCQKGLKQTVYAGDELKIGSGNYRLE